MLRLIETRTQGQDELSANGNDGSIQAITSLPLSPLGEQDPLLVLTDRPTSFEDVVALGRTAAGLYRGPVIFVSPTGPKPERLNCKIPGITKISSEFPTHSRSDSTQDQEENDNPEKPKVNILAIGDLACVAALELAETYVVNNLHLADPKPETIAHNTNFLLSQEADGAIINLYVSSPDRLPETEANTVETTFVTIPVSPNSGDPSGVASPEQFIINSIHDMPRREPRQTVGYKIVSTRSSDRLLDKLTDFIDHPAIIQASKIFGFIAKRVNNRFKNQ